MCGEKGAPMTPEEMRTEEMALVQEVRDEHLPELKRRRNRARGRERHNLMCLIGAVNQFLRLYDEPETPAPT